MKQSTIQRGRSRIQAVQSRRNIPSLPGDDHIRSDAEPASLQGLSSRFNVVRQKECKATRVAREHRELIPMVRSQYSRALEARSRRTTQGRTWVVWTWRCKRRPCVRTCGCTSCQNAQCRHQSWRFTEKTVGSRGERHSR